MRAGIAYKDMHISDVGSIRASDTFRRVVLQMWLAFSSPTCQPNMNRVSETSEEVYHREQVIRKIVGIPIQNEPGKKAMATDGGESGICGGGGNMELKYSNDGIADSETYVHTPFNTTELLWTGRRISLN